MQYDNLSKLLRTTVLALFSIALISCGSGEGEDSLDASAEDVSLSEYRLVFEDNFDTPAGRSARGDKYELPAGNWRAEEGYGDGGWGNDEWQFYQNAMTNLFLQDGDLVIRARCSDPNNGGRAINCGQRDGTITSARVITKDRVNVRYGRIQARIKMPSGNGMWPAFWTLGSDIDTNPWPDAGEIDIVEMHYFYSNQRTTHFATHWGGPRYTDDNRPICAANVDAQDPAEEENCKTKTKTFDYNLTDDYRVFEVEWNENVIKGKIDGITYFTQGIDAGTMEEFLKDHFLLLNVAVGGKLGGPFGPSMSEADWADRDQTDMRVDWVRVYELIPPSQATLIDESGDNLPYNRIINSAEFNDAFVKSDLDNKSVEPLVGDEVLKIKFRTTRSEKGGGVPAASADAIFDFNNLDVTKFDKFVFSIDTSQFKKFHDLGIEFEDRNGNKVQVRTSDYKAIPAKGNWVTYKIPLEDFAGVDPNTITGIKFSDPFDKKGTPIAGPLFVDDIRFTAASGTCDATPKLRFDSKAGEYDPATTLAQVVVKDPCAVGELVRVKVKSGKDEIFVGVQLDATGKGSGNFGFVDPLSVCPSDDSKGYIALEDPVLATYKSPASSNKASATARVVPGAINPPIRGQEFYFFATDPNQALAYIPDAPVANSFNYSPFSSGSGLNGSFSDSTFDPVFQVTSGTGYFAEVAQIALINISPGFANNKGFINFKFKNVGSPNDAVKIEFGILGGAADAFTANLNDPGVSTPLGDDWYEVRVPMTNFPNVANYNFMAFTSADPAPEIGNPFYFLITDIRLEQEVKIVPDECAEIVSPGGAGDGITPEFLLFSRDPGTEPDDLAIGVDWNPNPFTSGSTFDATVVDPDYPRVFGVTTGTGYTAVVGQLSIEGLPSGFASSNTTMEFKARGLNNDLIRVKFLPNGDYVDINLATSPNSTDLGAGWYQVSIPLTSFTGVADATSLLFETDNTAAANFTFYLTDIGFSGTAGGGGAGPGITPELMLFSRDPGTSPDDLVIGADWNPNPFTSGSVFDAGFVDPDYPRAFAVTTGTGYTAVVGQLSMEGLPSGFAAAYATLDFKARGLNNNLIRVKFLPNGDYVDINLATSPNSTDIGAGWYQVSISLTSFTGVADATALLFETDNTAAANFTFYLADVGFSGTAGGGGAGPGITPELMLFSRDPGTSPDDLVIGADWNPNPFTSGSIFDAGFVDPDYPRAFSVTTGTGYTAVVGQLSMEGLPSGFAAANATLDFKARGLNNNLIRVKFLPNGDYVDINLATSPNSTDVGAGWYQVSISLTSFTGVADATALLFETDNTAAANFTFYLTDVGFSGTAGGGGGGGGGGTEIIVNGDFEAGDTSNWFIVPNGALGGFVADGSVNNGGSFSVNITQSDAVGPPLIVQNQPLGAGALTENQQIEVSFDIIGTLDPGCVVIGQLDNIGGGPSNSVTIDAGFGVNAGSWTPASFSHTVSASAANLGVQFQFVVPQCGGGANLDVNVDNVSVRAQ